MSVVLCSWGDFIEGGTEETLSLAGRLSRARGLELDWLVIGGLAEAATAIAGKYGVTHIDHIAQDQHGPDALVASLADYCAQHSPSTILFNQTPVARLIAPRLAARLGVPVAVSYTHLTLPTSDLV